MGWGCFIIPLGIVIGVVLASSVRTEQTITRKLRRCGLSWYSYRSPFFQGVAATLVAAGLYALGTLKPFPDPDEMFRQRIARRLDRYCTRAAFTIEDYTTGRVWQRNASDLFHSPGWARMMTAGAVLETEPQTTGATDRNEVSNPDIQCSTPEDWLYRTLSWNDDSSAEKLRKYLGYEAVRKYSSRIPDSVAADWRLLGYDADMISARDALHILSRVTATTSPLGATAIQGLLDHQCIWGLARHHHAGPTDPVMHFCDHGATYIYEAIRVKSAYADWGAAVFVETRKPLGGIDDPVWRMLADIGWTASLYLGGVHYR